MPTKTKALTCACATLCTALLILVAFPQRVAAADGDDPPARVARLSYLHGSVSFQPAGESDWVTAGINRPMTTGDKLWADADSRAELHIGSAAIRLNSSTGFSFLNLDDRTVQIQLSAGTLALHVRRLEKDEVFEVDTPNQAFSILRPGEYRLQASEDGASTLVEVRVGKGDATGSGRNYTIESHQQAMLTGTDSLSARIDKMDKHERDEFDNWCEERDQREEHSRSVRYVSPEMVGYEDLDESGIWRYDPEYGEVWVPRAVPVGWAPYHYGHWAWIAPWGWTWVDDAPWGYAPFHYGRWAYASGSWFWVPGPVEVAPVYAPALVAFVGGSNFAVGVTVGGGAAVGWFPLGPREVYVPAYRTSPAYVTRVNVTNTNVSQTTVTNVYNTTVVNHTTVVNNVTYVNRTAPGAVTAVPTAAFTSAQPVATSAVAVNQSQISNAPVSTRAAVAPTQSSVLGPAPNNANRPMPPGLVNRPVVAKTTPPPPPVPFERQESALKAHPGQPLQRNEVENLRPAEVAHPLIRPASPNQPQVMPNRGTGQTAGTAGGPNRPENPPNSRPNGVGYGPANNPSANAPGRNERPDAERPGNRPAVSETPSAQPNYRPGQQNRPEQPVSTTTAEPSSNRPSNVQPSYRPPSQESRPNPTAPVDERPAINNRPQNPPSNTPYERPALNAQPENTPAPAPSNNRPTGHPSYRPPSQENRPEPGAPSNERPSINNQPLARPEAASPNERPTTNSQPQSASQPNNRRVEERSNAPVGRPAAPETRSAVPSPQPSGSVRAVPENKGRAPSPAPAKSNNNSSGNKKKENEKKN